MNTESIAFTRAETAVAAVTVGLFLWTFVASVIGGMGSPSFLALTASLMVVALSPFVRSTPGRRASLAASAAMLIMFFVTR